MIIINTIKNLFEKHNSADFSKAIISLELEEEFENIRNNNKEINELFDFCVRYLDIEITNKQEIERQIKNLVDKLS